MIARFMIAGSCGWLGGRLWNQCSVLAIFIWAIGAGLVLVSFLLEKKKGG